MRGFARMTRALGVLTYDVEGAERLGRPGQLIVANHPTLIDGVFLLGLAPGSVCIVKAALVRNPFTRGSVAAAGYVSNSPTDQMIEDAADVLRAGGSVIMFPEGTRAAAVVTPVHVRCNPLTLAKREPWHRVPDRRPHFLLRVGADIDPAPFRSGAPRPIAARAFNEQLLRAFTELDRAGDLQK